MRHKRPWRRDQTSTTRQKTTAPYTEESPEIARFPRPGSCEDAECGEEAACKKLPNDHYTCICPHDLSPPTIDLQCPNRLTVPLTPRPIHNIIPPTGGNNTTETPNATTTTPTIETVSGIDLDTGTSSVITLGVSGSAIILLIVIVLCWRSKGISCKHKPSRKPEPPLTGEPLLAERYISNPQYSSGYGRTNAAEDRICVSFISLESLTFNEEIGEGCFGKVFKGELKLENSSITVAIKVLKNNASRSAEDDFNREVSTMSAFCHENILRLIGVVPKVNIGQNPWMVFEYMPYGDLAEVLRSNSPSMRTPIPGLPPLNNKELLLIAMQIANGMKYLAQQRFVHRDLACRNCLVGENLAVKIADFGMSRDVYTCDYYKMGGTRPMPIRWMSPESIVYARFTLESDVWSFGVVLWEIYSLGKQPFFGYDNEEARNRILQGIMLVPPVNCPVYICELMRACWNTDPKDRIKFTDICVKLNFVKNSQFIDDSAASVRSNGESWSRSLGRPSARSGQGLPVPPTTLPNIPLYSSSPLPTSEQLMDPEGYLVPAHPTDICEYLTTIPN